MQISSVSLINKIQNSVSMRGVRDTKPATAPMEERSQSSRDSYLDYAENQGKFYRAMAASNSAEIKSKELQKSPDKLIESIKEMSKQVITEDEADVFIQKVLEYIENADIDTSDFRQVGNKLYGEDEQSGFMIEYLTSEDGTELEPYKAKIIAKCDDSHRSKNEITIEFDMQNDTYKAIHSKKITIDPLDHKRIAVHADLYGEYENDYSVRGAEPGSRAWPISKDKIKKY